MALKCVEEDISETEQKIRDQRKDDICEEFHGQLKSRFYMEFLRILCPTICLCRNAHVYMAAVVSLALYKDPDL